MMKSIARSALLILVAVSATFPAYAYEPPEIEKPIYADSLAVTKFIFSSDSDVALSSMYDMYVCELKGTYDPKSSVFHLSSGNQSCDMPATFVDDKITVGDDRLCRVACSPDGIYEGTFSGEYKRLKPECDGGYILTSAQTYIESGTTADDAAKYLEAFSQTESACDGMLRPYVKSGMLLATAKAFAHKGDYQNCLNMYQRVEYYISTITAGYRKQNRLVDESSFEMVTRYMTSDQAFCKQ